MVKENWDCSSRKVDELVRCIYEVGHTAVTILSRKSFVNRYCRKRPANSISGDSWDGPMAKHRAVLDKAETATSKNLELREQTSSVTI